MPGTPPLQASERSTTPGRKGKQPNGAHCLLLGASLAEETNPTQVTQDAQLAAQEQASEPTERRATALASDCMAATPPRKKRRLAILTPERVPRAVSRDDEGEARSKSD